MRKRRLREEFGRIPFSRTGWKSYSHLVGDERAAFSRLMRSPRLAFLLALFLGYTGAHRFYLGHYRFGFVIVGFSVLAFFSGSSILMLIAAVIVLIEVGHIVRTTEQFNDSIEGALMLKTFSKPLFNTEQS